MTTRGPDRSEEEVRPPTPASVEAVYFQEGRWSSGEDAGGGSSVDIDELCGRYPQMAGHLREIHGQWQRFRSVVAERTLALDPSSGGREAGDGSRSPYAARATGGRPAAGERQRPASAGALGRSPSAPARGSGARPASRDGHTSSSGGGAARGSHSTGGIADR